MGGRSEQVMEVEGGRDERRKRGEEGKTRCEERENGGKKDESENRKVRRWRGLKTGGGRRR